MTLGVIAAAADGPAMHIPDGFLSAPVATAGWVLAGVGVALAVRRAERRLDERAVPLMGVMAAFIFATQMMNFPVAGGTSGHLIGGAVAAILLGPAPAIVVMTAVVSLQALLFQDGGLGALGANVLFMGVTAVLTGHFVYRLLQPLDRRLGTRAVATFAAAWLSVEVAALGTSLALVISDASPLDVVLPAMLGVHALVGIGEGLISVAVVAFVSATRPDLLEVGRAARSMPLARGQEA
jgi:cobalt/nickel transport system permease protein